MRVDTYVLCFFKQKVDKNYKTLRKLLIYAERQFYYLIEVLFRSRRII